MGNEGKHRRDLLINSRVGVDGALSEILSILREFNPEIGDWQSLPDRVFKNAALVCVHGVGGEERNAVYDRVTRVFSNCRDLYQHVKGVEGHRPHRAHERVMNLVESSLTMDQFNARVVEVLAGKPSNDTVNENLEESRRIIFSRH